MVSEIVLQVQNKSSASPTALSACLTTTCSNINTRAMGMLMVCLQFLGQMRPFSLEDARFRSKVNKYIEDIADNLSTGRNIWHEADRILLIIKEQLRINRANSFAAPFSFTPVGTRPTYTTGAQLQANALSAFTAWERSEDWNADINTLLGIAYAYTELSEHFPPHTPFDKDLYDEFLVDDTEVTNEVTRVHRSNRAHRVLKNMSKFAPVIDSISMRWYTGPSFLPLPATSSRAKPTLYRKSNFHKSIQYKIVWESKVLLTAKYAVLDMLSTANKSKPLKLVTDARAIMRAGSTPQHFFHDIGNLDGSSRGYVLAVYIALPHNVDSANISPDMRWLFVPPKHRNNINDARTWYNLWIAHLKKYLCSGKSSTDATARMAYAKENTQQIRSAIEEVYVKQYAKQPEQSQDRSRVLAVWALAVHLRDILFCKNLLTTIRDYERCTEWDHIINKVRCKDCVYDSVSAEFYNLLENTIFLAYSNTLSY